MKIKIRPKTTFLYPKLINITDQIPRQRRQNLMRGSNYNTLVSKDLV